MIVLNFFKVFRKVPHQRLLLKLRGNLLGWMKCFLTYRSQKVVLKGIVSEEVLVSSGVLQEEVLVPLFFLLYIDYIHRNIDSQMRYFEDDFLVHRVIKQDSDCPQLQKNISSLCVWESTWRMTFNKPKCYVIHMIHKKIPGNYGVT